MSSLPRTLATLLVTLLPLAVAAADSPPTPGPSCAVPGFSSVYVPAPRVFSGARQDEEGLSRLKAMGVGLVIDLRASEEAGFESEDALVQRLGLAYQRIPIRDIADLNRENAALLDEALASAGERSVLIHCLSGMRAAALYALREAWIKGRSPDEAIALGQRMGIGDMEPVLSKLLKPE